MNDLPKFQKLMEDIIEFLLSKENEEENFLIFCENNCIETIIAISEFQEKSINLIIIKIFGILIPSLKNNKIMFYLFSNNYMNQIITNISYNKEDNDTDYLSFYINFLKTLANKLDLSSFSLFFNSSHNKFPLLDEIIIFLTYDQDVMIKNTSRNIFLTLLNLNYEPFIEYICDLPTITLFLLFAENLKKQIKYFCQNKDYNFINIDNNKNYINKINELEEREEILRDDISFIQDILNINIPKINYLLINTLFFIPIGYLFNNILTRQNANISFYVLELFLEILKNESIKNIIIFILYSCHIQIKIIEIVANEETNDIYKLLRLNKYVFHSNISNIKNIKFNSNNILAFDDYIILNYSKKFLKSLRYIKDTDNTYEELINISNQLNFNDNTDNDINLAIKYLNKKVDRINYVIKNIENYHGFISRATGINCGASYNSAKDCFLQTIYNNLMAYKDNNANKNIYLQENIFKNECQYYIYDFHLTQYMCTVNELFLLSRIINNETISEKLKQKLNLLKNSLDKSKKEYSNDVFFNINSIDDNESINEFKTSQNFITKPGLNSEAPPVANNFQYLNQNDNNKTTDDNGDNLNVLNFSVIQPNSGDLYQQVFGSEDFKRNYKRHHSYMSAFLSLPSPVNNNIKIIQFNNNINLIVDNKIMCYKDMDFNNEFFDKILYNYKTNNETQIINKIIDLLIDGKRILNKLIYKISIDIIEDLLLSSINFWSIKKKYQIKINEHYKQILQMINDFLEKNNINKNNNNKNKLEQNEYNNFILEKNELIKDKDENQTFYELFEECFIFNTKDINKDIKKNIFEKPILLTTTFTEGEELYKIQFDLLKIPDKKYQIIKCIFQKMLALYDLKIIINGFNDVSKDKLLKYQKFPLYFFAPSEFNIDSKININDLKIESYKLKFKLEQEEIFNDYIIIFMQNYILFCMPLIENKIIDNKDIGDKKKEEFLTIKGDEKNNNNIYIEDEYGIIKYKIPLRHLEISNDYKEENNKNDKNNNQEIQNKEKMIILNNTNNKSKIMLLFENIFLKNKFEDAIKDNIKKAVEMEYNSLKMYIDKLLKDYSTINN